MKTPKHTLDASFTLVCQDCDAGMDIQNHDQAVTQEWTEIDYAPHLPMALEA